MTKSRPTHKMMIERAIIAIMSSAHWCWLTSVILLGNWKTMPSQKIKANVRGKEIEFDFTEIHTAATDGFNVIYNEDFLDKAWDVGGDRAVRLLVLHENLHKAYRQVSIWKGLFDTDATRANIAVDVIVNNDIAETPIFCMNAKELGDAMDACFVHMPVWAHLNAGQIFELLDDPNQMKKTGFGQGDKGKTDIGDVHIPGAGESGAGDDATDELFEGPAGQSEEVRDALLDAAVRQGIIMQRGRDPGKADRNAAAMAPKVDWRVALRNWLSGRSFGYDMRDWKKRSRRSRSMGVYLPSSYSERTGKLLIAVDTSGSIGNDLLGQFLGEIGALCLTLSPLGVDVIFWDTEVASAETFHPAQYRTIAQQCKPAGGGGTRLGAALEYAKKMRDLRGIIILSDMYVEAQYQGQWPADVLCVVNTNAPCSLPHVRI